MRRVGWSGCLIPNAGGLTNVACSSPFQCVAVNTVGIVTSDVNTRIEVVVTARNAAGSASAASNPVLIALGHKTFRSTRAGLRITLNARGKRLLGRASRATLTGKIAFTPSHHATVSNTKTLVVKR